MAVILLLFFTLTCVCGLPQVPLYQAEEDHKTLRWDSPNKMDLSFINIHCLSKSIPIKCLFRMIRGDEKSQDEQFSGRVHCDREALKEGRVWIDLFRLKPEDSGDYKCDMSIYDPVKRESEFLFREHFQLNVTLKGGVTMATPKDNPIIADVTLTEDTLPKNPEHTDLSVEMKRRNHWSKVSVVIVVIVLCGALLVLSQIKNICKKFKKDSVSNDNNKVPVENGEALLTAADDTTMQMEREEEERVT